MMIMIQLGCEAGPCAVCGQAVDEEDGPSLVHEGRAVCEECGWADAPILTSMVQAWQAVELGLLASEAIEDGDKEAFDGEYR